MYIGQRIMKYRIEHNLSMQEFADKAGVTKAYIGMLEREKNNATGKPIIPTALTMAKLAAALGEDRIELIQEARDSNSEGVREETT